ncbi:MAG: Ig-like domain-containing protein [Casimicrobiaceae bacterium]
MAFIQGDGTISQAVNLAAGTYQVSVKAIQRKENHDAPAGITLSIEVDGAIKWSGVPDNVAYRTYATPAMALTAGSHTILIRSTNQVFGYDNTIFVDAAYVGAPVAPTVSLTAPAANQIYAAPASVAFAAIAASPNSAIAKVEFYNGAALVGTDVSTPYAFAWNNIAAGAYSVSALAYDNLGVVVSSGAVPIIVCGPPTVTMTSPASGATVPAPATFTLSANASTAPGCGAIQRVEFYGDSGLLNTDTTAPYSFVWSGVAAGSHTLKARAYDARGLYAEAIVVVTATGGASALADGSFELPALPNPSYQPASGPTIFGSPWTFAGANGSRGISTNGSLFTAQTVNTTDGKQVAFIQGDGTVSQAVNLAAGTYQVSLKAIQRKENQDSSGMVLSIEVDTVVKWTGIPDNVAYRTYATPAMALGAGSHTITIRGVNPALNDNTVFIDTVYLGVPAAPTVSLTGPAANQVYTAPASVAFAATAASPNSAIAKVEFWNAATLVGSDLASPYAFTWTNAPAGAYSVFAQAYDNLGVVTASGAVRVYVCGPPTVTLTSPSSGATGFAPATFTLSAAASTATGCGAIQRVEFYGDNGLLNTDLAAPYSYDWSGVGVGSHTVKARAYDSRGLYAEVSIAVNVSASGAVGDADLVCTTPVVTSNVGATPGTFGVSDTGAATYSIPVQVPPGTAGMQPGLTLNYSSQGGSGHVGAGWGVSGLSMIGRCPGTEAQDGKRTAINYDTTTTNDAYCLDGQRLVPVAQSGNTVEYRTEIESYSKIVRYDDNLNVVGPGRWRVWTKSGQILDYGSRWWILSAGWYQRLYDATRTNSVKVWALDRVMDRTGNYMEIDYDGTNGLVTASAAQAPVGFNAVTPPGSFPDVEFWPTAIRYYGVHSSAVTDPGYNEVVLNYSDRSNVAPRDVQRFYDQGAGASTLTKKLDSIRVTVDKSSSTPGTVTRTYTMTYGASPVTQRMLLQQVQECAGDGTCLAATTFNWSGSSSDLAWFLGTGSSPAITAANADASTVRIADLNGDGKSDMIRYVGASGFLNQWEVCLGPLGSCATYTINSYGDNGDISRWEVADTVGDGKARLLTWDVTSKTWRSCLFNGNGFDACVTQSGPILYRTNSEWNEFFWGDFDGDGKIDILTKTNTGRQLINGAYYNSWDMCFATGKAPPDSGFKCILATKIPENTASGNLRDRVLIADVNGDGKADYLEKSDQDPTHDQWRVCLSKFDQADLSKAFDCPAQYTGGIKGDFERAVILDVNGDGLADMLTLLDKSTVASTETCKLNSTVGCWQVCIATGDGGFEYTDPALHWTAAGLVNGKGSQVDPLTAPRCRIWSGQNTTTFKNVLYGDFNGDGRTDTTAWDPSSRTFVVCYSTGSSFNCAAQFNNFPSWPNAGNNHPASEFSAGDFNGDGKTDIAIRNSGSGNTWVLGMASDTFADQLKTITTGLQATTKIAYAPITNAFVYTKGTAAQQSVQPRELVIQSPLYVVQETRASNGVGSDFVSTYFYEGLKGRTDGRGIEGFFRRRTLDGNGIVSEVESLQVWPLSGRPMRMSKWAPKDGLRANPSILQASLLEVRNANFSLVNASTQTWTTRSYASGVSYQGLTIASISQPTAFARSIQQVHLIETREQSFEYPNGPPLPETVTTIPIAQVDTFGNRGFVQVSTYDAADGGSYLKETTSTYNNDNVNWLLGRVKRSDVRSVKANGQSAFRASSWVYGTTQPNPSAPYDGVCWWGMVCSEIVEPDYAGDTVNYGLWQETQYLYDRYGNRQSATIRFQERDGANVVTIKTRTTTTNFYDGDTAANNRGRLSLSTVNPLNHKESRVYDNRFGTVAVVNGPNGLSTSTLFDGLGRRVCDASFDATSGTGHRLSQTEVLIQACASADPSYPTASSCQLQESYRVRTKASGGGWGYAFYDNLQRERRTVAKAFNANAWAETATTYDALGRKATTRKPAGAGTLTVQPSYDVLNRVTSELTTGNDGSSARTTTSSTAYSALTTTITRTNPSGGLPQITSRTVNSQRLTTSATDAVGTTSFLYDPFGNLTKVTGPTLIVVAMTYDKRGRKITMTDPDMGFDQVANTTKDWLYRYNGAGELIWQRDAKGQENRLVYDMLGRMVERREYAGAETGAVVVGTLWTYDSCAVGKGRLCSTESHGGTPYTAANLTHRQSIAYDGAARPTTSTTTIGASTFVSITQYDNNGRVAQVQYPSGLVAAQSYAAWGGHLSKVTDSSGVTTYWKASNRYLDGQIASMQVGPHTTTHIYDPLGRVKAVVTPGVQNANYTFDEVGNLLGRGDAIVGQATETFGYDPINRLVTANGLTIAAYDAAGNITSRSGTGAYTYWPGTHRLRTTGGSTYNYDASGNLTTGGGRTVTMAPFNMPSRISGGSGTLDYVYDGGHARIVETSSSSGVTYFVGNQFYEEQTRPDGSVYRRHYISTPEGVIALVLQRLRPGLGNDTLTRYWHKDHLGSLAAVTSETGAVVERFTYDVWGRRLTPYIGTGEPLEERGFTGHEMLDDVAVGGIGLVHMNGRIYDPFTGRFLSADPLVQDAYNIQSYNRYTYVLNNPLSFTDPTGFSWWTKWRRPIIAIVAAIATYGIASAWMAAIALESANGATLFAAVADFQYGATVATLTVEGSAAAGAAAGFAAGGIMGGNLESAVYGAITGAAGGFVSGYYGGAWTLGRVGVQTAVGTASAYLTGGDWRRAAEITLAISLLSYGNVALREVTIESSRRFVGICSTDNFCVDNMSGSSAGLLDDNLKAGGGRLKLFAICNEGTYTCIKSEDAPWKFSGTGEQLRELLVKQESALGGLQGGAGKFIGIPYSPGTLLDRVVESFSGPHDYFNSGFWYDNLGNAINRTGLEKVFGEVLNGFNVFPASSFAIAVNIPAGAYDALAIRPKR